MQLIFILLSIVAIPLVFIVIVYIELLYKQDTNKISISSLESIKNKFHIRTAFHPAVSTIESKNEVGYNVKPSYSNEAVVIKENYDHDKPNKWNKIIKELFQLGVSNPLALHHRLMTEDIFETFSFPNIINSSSTYTCPYKFDRIDYPDITNHHNLELFLNSTSTSTSEIVSSTETIPGFLFYQHLRKAGGTGFCDLATSNLGRNHVPSYFCMPDNKGSLATPPWDNTTYLRNMIQKRKYFIVANEWDVILDEHIAMEGSVLATTMRHPIDRWYSQYRFEHLEHRDGRSADSAIVPMLKWYQSNAPWEMGTNYYIKTFVGYKDEDSIGHDLNDYNIDQNSNSRNHGNSNSNSHRLHKKKEEGMKSKKKKIINYDHFYWSYTKYQHVVITYALFQKALYNLRQFHLLLITEWLDTSNILIQKKLHFLKSPTPRKILPHESQAVRKTKKSLSAQEILEVADYEVLVKENVLDILFFMIAKRIYIERYYCLSSE